MSPLERQKVLDGVRRAVADLKSKSEEATHLHVLAILDTLALMMKDLNSQVGDIGRQDL